MAGEPKATLAVVNGKVWPPRDGATALAVGGDRIAASGSDRHIRALCGRRTRVVDARGGTILPAFNDAHVHFLQGARSLSELNLQGAETLGEVERRIAAYAARHKGPWVVGRGWFYSAFPGGLPTVELLDRLIPDRPAYIESYDAHTGWANTRALATAGLGSTGVLKESAMLGVARHIPARSSAEDLEALGAGMRLAAEHGIGSVQEAGGGQDQLELWDALRETGELTLRVRLAFDMVPGLDAETWRERLDLYEELAHGRQADPWIATGILKAFADGVIESRTAAMLEPYEGTSELGTPLWDGDELVHAVRVGDARGWQVQVHAIGDAAIRQALDAFAATAFDRRHRIEHIESPSPLDLPRFAELGVIASMQPQHAEPNRNLFEMWLPNLGIERAAHAWPWRTILHSSARIAFGTDWPVVPLDPAASLHVAVTRQTRRGEPAGGWLPDQRLKLAEALAGWTFGGAYAEHAEDRKGTLRDGMLADIAVLDQNILTTSPSDLHGLKVTATIVGGRVVHER
ncbi:MAG TPA: amidohydrolase [Candidatus Dormibacteraeota bacterium]|nr:amidohydrolase [Candidatus Dormibacteraeota bacterium]